MKLLRSEKYFNYEEKELLGIMRFDFYDGEVANQWNPKGILLDLSRNKIGKLKRLQKELNLILFNLLSNFDTVVKLCGDIGYSNESLFYIDFGLYKYVIKLIPTRDSYSYIYVYLK